MNHQLRGTLLANREGSLSLSPGCFNSERALQLISSHGDKNSYQEYLVTLCKIIIKLNKVTTIDVRDGSVGSS